MKKRTKRLLAMLLASAMIMQQGSTVGVLATESEPASETVAETTAATEAETKTPETKAPETQAPETKAPETQAVSETQATEAATSAAQTETATSETTETTEKVTEAAATEATEAPAETGKTPDAEADTDDVTEKVDEAEETEAPKTNFTYEDSRVKITAVAQEAAKLPQDAQIHADYMKPGTPEYQAAAAALEAAYAGKDVVLDYVFYDIYFTAASAGNGRIEPEAGTVTVNIQFKQPELKPEADAEVQTYDVVHVENGKAQEVPSNVQMTGDGSVASVGFTSGDFSPYAVVMSVEEQDEVATIGADEEPDVYNDLSKFFTSMTVKVDGKDMNPDNPVSPSTEFEFSITFSDNGKTENIKKYSSFQMPDNLVNWPDSGILTNSRGEKVADYTIDSSGKVKITFTDEFMQQADTGHITGEFHFKAQVKSSGTEGDVKVQIPKTDLTVDVYINHEVALSATKNATYDPNTGIITYTVDVTALNGAATDVHILDELGDGLELVPLSDDNENNYSVTIDDSTSYGEFTEEAGKKKASIGVLKEGQHAIVTYKAKFKDDDILDRLLKGDSTLTNNKVSARGSNGGNNIESNEPSVNVGDKFKDYTWFTKSGQIEKSSDGSVVKNEDESITVKWTVKYNSSQLVSVKGNTISDELEGDLTKFAADAKVTVTRSGADGEKTTFTFGVNSDLNGWSYTIGSDTTNDPYVTGKEVYEYIFEYETTVSKETLDSIIGSKKISNKVNDNKGHSSSGEVSIDGNIQPNKITTGVTEKTTSWQITVTAPAGGMDFYIRDEVQEDGQNDHIWDKYGKIDPESIVIEPTVDHVFVQSTASDDHNAGYFFFGIGLGTSVGDIEANKVKSRLPEGTYTIKYNTYNYYEKDGKQIPFEPGITITNTASGDGWKKSAENMIPGNLRVKKNTEGNYHTLGGQNGDYFVTGGNRQCYSIIIDQGRYGLGDGTVTITDTHSENMSLVEGSLCLFRGKHPEYFDDSHPYEVCGTIDSYSDKDGVLTVHLSGLTGEADDNRSYVYRLYYTMEIDSTVFTSSVGEKLSNQAKVEIKDGSVAETGKVEIDYKNPPLTKEQQTSPAQSNQYTATFKIEVPSVSDYHKNEKGELVILDEVSSSLVVDYESIKVTGEKNWASVSDIAYNITPGNPLKIVIKNPENGAKYTITYNAVLKGAYGAEIPYTNKAWIPAHPLQFSEVSDKKTKQQGSGGSAETTGYKFHIFKYDSENANIKLSGAEFSLYDASGTELKSGIKIENGSSGPVSLSRTEDKAILEPNKKYYLVETKAPQGYVLDKTPIYFYFTDDTLTEEQLQAEGLKDITAIYGTGSLGGTISIPNTAAGLAIKKVDKDNSSETLEGAEFGIYQEEECTTLVASSKESGNGIYNFRALDVGQYYLKETKAPKGYKLSETVYKVEVYEDGSYSVDGKKLGGDDIANLLVVENEKDEKGSLTIKKATTYPEGVIEPKEFKFTVQDSKNQYYGEDGTAHSGKVTVTVPANGSVEIENLPFDTYTVTEVTTGVTVPTGYVWTVKVGSETKNSSEVELSASKPAGTVAFTNTYTKKTGTSIVLKGTKALLGGELAANTYEFAITQDSSDNIKVTCPGKVKNDADGNFTFDEIDFSEADTYHFTVKEVAGTDDEQKLVDYDETTYTITVVVKDKTDGSGVEIESVTWGSQSLTKDSTDGAYKLPEKAVEEGATEKATFVNRVKKGSLKIKKTVSKPTDVTAPTSFLFTVQDASGNYYNEAGENKGNVKTTITVAAGTEKAVYNLPVGMYTVTEVTEGEDAPKVPDDCTWTVTVNGRTTSTVEVEVSDGKAAGYTPNTAEFLNTYAKKDDASFVLKGTKKLIGGTLAADAYSFRITQDTGDKTKITSLPVDVPNNSAGVFTFSAIKFTDAGTYTFYVQEVQGDENAKKLVEYDTTTYTVIVEVKEKSDKSGVYIESVTCGDSKLTNTGSDGAYELPKQKDEGTELASFVNRVRKGSLKITKNVTLNGEATTGTEADGTYTFNLTKEGDSSFSKTVTIKIENGKSKTETVNDLVPGVYTVSEVVPTGMTLIEGNDIELTVTADNTTDIPTATFTNNKEMAKISIQKVYKDEEGKTYPLAGAKLVVRDSEGKIVEGPWVSEVEPHVFTGLAAGTYTLSELEAPQGYDVAKDVPFTINGTEAPETPIKVEMTDTKTKPTTYSLTVTKHVRLDGFANVTGDVGISNEIFYVALFSDSDRTQRVSDVKKIEFKNALAGSVTFENLDPTLTYYVGETDVNGTMVPAAKVEGSDMDYYAEYGGKSMFKFEGSTTHGLAEFTNVFVKWPDYLYLSGQLTVTKKVLLNGAPEASTDTFYARVFSDAGLTQPASEILALSMAGGSEASVLVTNLSIGNTVDSSAKYYVAETDAYGTPLNPSAVTEYTISVDKSEVTLSGSHPSDTVVITNDFTEKESEFESEASEFEESESESETEVAKKTAPKTGDDTDFMKYLLLMALSAGACAVIFEEKRRRNRADR